MPTPTPSPPHPSLLTTLQKTGYLTLPSLLTPPELTALRAAATHLTTIARTGIWPHVRTVGKQFPPWDASLVPHQAGIWGVQHLLHPDLPISQAERDAFVGVYFHKRLLGAVGELLGLDSSSEEEMMTMELMNMLVRPDGGEGFELCWHRDDIPASATAEEEVEKLRPKKEKGYGHTQWNLPLFDDESLVVVPGSHRRARTEAERAADPYEKDFPGQVTVKLRAGDVVFYDNNILHRGVYDAARERMTLHGSVGHAGASRDRARNVLQHGVGDWVDRCDFSGLKDKNQRKTAEGMRRRLVELGRENEGKDVGFSLEG
ncbi:hypothetical protein C8A00DRAFT_46212 [Chaetomidium leptoderma]|uniref:Phytanoyl-CoA dioxygenase n=1 Tax=Chaetomidium leptoderma TaxID=669021 RepID=A0AAN6VHR3_9PEZI|nr:hypothetical protein C8A00DRAFT_46212 [Chaetomidium leptoderma]